MEPINDTLRDRLLVQVQPDPDRLARYREEVRIMLEQKERGLRWQQWTSVGNWLFVVLLMTAFMVVGGMSGKVPNWFMPYILGLTLLIGAAVQLLSYHLNRSHVELLKEIKGLELQVRELKDQLVK
jgi:hypothetical protein